ncbi:MAG: metallophosphoesterase [Desulfurococcaceae archaeon]
MGTRTLQIIHTSDLHLVPEMFENTPVEEAFYNVFGEIAEKTIESGVKYLLIAGDMFDKPSPPLGIVMKAVSVLRRLRENGVRVVVVPGNHDVSRSRPGVLNLLAEAGLIHLLEFSEEMGWLLLNPLVFEDDKLVLYGIPGFPGGGSREVRFLKQGLVKFKNLSTYKNYNVVVLAHINTKFAGYDPSRYYNRYGKLYLEYEDLLRRFPGNTIYVALGHIHLPIPLDTAFRSNIAYPGAPIGMNVGDLLETAELEKLGAFRRSLLVDTSSTLPLVKSIRLESALSVLHENVTVKGIDELKDRLAELVGRAEGSGYTALIVDVNGMDRLNSEIEAFRRDLMKKKNVYIKLRLVDAVKALPIPVVTINAQARQDLSIPEIELNVLKEFISKHRLNMTADKLKRIIDLLGSPYDVSPERLLEEVIKELGELKS